MTGYHQQGVSMIEVLITIVVMSFGFLSLASFQMATLGHLSGNNQDYVATILAASMGESLRSNLSNLADYDGASTEDFDIECAAPGDCTVVQEDMLFFRSALADHALPNAIGTINVGGNSADVRISWLSAGATVSYRLQVPL